MSNSPIPVNSQPWPPWPILGEAEKEAVVRVIASNQLFAAGEVAAFEGEYADYVGARFARGVGNATEGLHLALAALNIGVNDEVIVPPYTWISSASCVVMQNGVPVFADCDAATLALSAETIEAKITNRTII